MPERRRGFRLAPIPFLVPHARAVPLGMFHLPHGVGDEQPEPRIHLRQVRDREPADLVRLVICDPGGVLSGNAQPEGGVDEVHHIVIGIGDPVDRSDTEQGLDAGVQPGLLLDLPNGCLLYTSPSPRD